MEVIAPLLVVAAATFLGISAFMAWVGLGPLDRAPRLWSAAYLCAGVGMALPLMVPQHPVVARAVCAPVFLLYPWLIWTSARTLHARAPRYSVLSLLGLCAVVAIGAASVYGAPRFVILGYSLSGALLASAMARELGKDVFAHSRGPVIARSVAWTHMAFMLGLSAFAAWPGDPEQLPSRYLFAVSEALLYGVLQGFSLVSLAWEPVAQRSIVEAGIDSLTGLLNRRGLLMRVDREPQLRKWLSVIAVDLDHFKSINDTFGHPTGGRVLIIFAAAARATCEHLAVISRVGGEEFLLVLSVRALAAAWEDAERLRTAYRERAYALVADLGTLSAGIAAGNVADYEFAQLWERADRALYRAKREGRDRTSVAP